MVGDPNTRILTVVSNDPGEYLAELGMSPKSITGGNFLRITAEWVQADYNGNFIVTLSNSGGNIATAHFIYGDFAGGLTTIYEPLTWISGRENQPVTQWYLSGTFNAHPERYYGDLRLTDMSATRPGRGA